MKRSTPLCRHIGGKVRFFRKKRGMTQEELAARLQTRGCNITRAMVGHIETGYRTASVFEIDMLVEVLGIDYNALFARDLKPRRDWTSPGIFDTMAIQISRRPPGRSARQGGCLPCTH